jgi:hypothetical protein
MAAGTAMTAGAATAAGTTATALLARVRFFSLSHHLIHLINRTSLTLASPYIFTASHHSALSSCHVSSAFFSVGTRSVFSSSTGC